MEYLTKKKPLGIPEVPGVWFPNLDSKLIRLWHALFHTMMVSQLVDILKLNR